MIAMLRDLVAHKGHANAILLNTIRDNHAAASDPEMLELLHHILLANRFWLVTILGLPFAIEVESRRSASFDELIQRYRHAQQQEMAWLATATDADVSRMLADPFIPGGNCSIAQALMQVCMHSHGHRAQCAKLLRRHGGQPPPTDFILWLADRPEPAWPL